jgi:hypothetical protein
MMAGIDGLVRLPGLYIDSGDRLCFDSYNSESVSVPGPN